MLQFKNNNVAMFVIIVFVSALVLMMIGNADQILAFFAPRIAHATAAKRAVNYINANLLANSPDKAKLNRISEESGVIKINITVAGTSYDSYVSKDGKILFPDGLRMGGKAVSPTPQPASSRIDITKVSIDKNPSHGDPSAPIVIAYWFDYQCPFCKKAELETLSPLMKDYVDAKKVRIVYKDYQFLGSDSTTAGLAARAVWEVAPDRFYDWHKGMMEKQDDENGGWGKKEDILALTQSLGIDSGKVGGLMDSKKDEYQKAIDEDKAEGSYYGINGTPGFIIGKELISGFVPSDTLKNKIEGALKEAS